LEGNCLIQPAEFRWKSIACGDSGGFCQRGKQDAAHACSFSGCFHPANENHWREDLARTPGNSSLINEPCSFSKIDPLLPMQKTTTDKF